MLNPGDIVRSKDNRDEIGCEFVVLEAGINHVSGPAVKVAALVQTPIYRLASSLEKVDDYYNEVSDALA